MRLKAKFISNTLYKLKLPEEATGSVIALFLNVVLSYGDMIPSLLSYFPISDN